MRQRISSCCATMELVSLSLLLLFASHLVCCGASHNISLVVMAPFPDELTVGWDRGPAIIPGAIIAAREVNNSTEILPDFNLQLRVADSGCSATSKAKISILRDIFENRAEQVVGIIGPACSGAALAVSNLTSREQLSLIHVTSGTSPLLEDPKRSTTYATISSAFSYVQSFLELMLHNNWTNIATLQDVGRVYFQQTHSMFLRTLDTTRPVYSGNIFTGNSMTTIPLDDIQYARARVIMVFAGSEAAGRLLCYAYRRNMIYPSYQWIFHDRTGEQLIRSVKSFRVNGEPIECSIEEMAEASHGVILNLFRLERKNKNMTLPLLRKTYDDYHKEYLAELRNHGNLSGDIYANSYHDAVWALAIALHNASAGGVNLKSYTYNRSQDTKEIARHLSGVQFEGVTGPVYFQGSTRSAETVIDIKQLLRSEEVLIGIFDRTQQRQERLLVKTDIAKFVNDTYTRERVKLHPAVTALSVLIALALSALTVFLHMANTLWSHCSSIKATSPNVSHLIFSGCYLYLICLFISSLFSDFELVPFSIVCNTLMWCFFVGYSLIFGTLCAKAWRVYRLFKHFRNKKPGIFLSDNVLVIFVSVLVLADVVICTLWTVFDAQTMRTVLLTSSDPPQVVLVPLCDCNHWTLWIAIMVVYKGAINLSLMTISILNRRIKRKNFQQTRSITVMIYSMTIIYGISIPLYYLFRNRSIYVSYVFFVVVSQCTVLLCCFLLFLPPLLPILKQRTQRKRISVRVGAVNPVLKELEHSMVSAQ